MTIPPTLYFCWIGQTIPWAYVFAVLSAAERSGLTGITLYHTDMLQGGDQLNALRQAPRVRLSQVEPIAYLCRIGERLGLGDELARLYRRLASPVMRSDVLRAAILYAEGGIYLDMDTITTSSLLPLTGTQHFVGTEFIIWPHFMRAQRTPRLWTRQIALDLLRKASRRLPDGWKLFRKMEKFCFRSINNAVMGAAIESPLVADYLRAMTGLSPARQTQRYALGPHLLQEVATCNQYDDLVVQEPHIFYPLPPQISEHWFRIVRNVALSEIVLPETRVVHWYASVRTRALVAQITPAYVKRNRKRQLYSALVCSCIDQIPDAA